MDERRDERPSRYKAVVRKLSTLKARAPRGERLGARARYHRRGDPIPRRTPSIVLLPPTPEERANFIERQTVDYADAKARAGMWPAAEALTRARKEIAGVLAERGPHEILKAVDAKGKEVGWVWIGPVPGTNSPSAIRWLYQITVDERLRGRGYGRALLAATERSLRAQGVSELRLNVFAWNQVAISLYESSGYGVAERVETNLEMRKRLS